MITISVKNMQNKLRIPRQRIEKLARRILEGEDIRKTGYLNICFTDNLLIRKLNSRFLGVCAATDVLAFNLNARACAKLEADIAISAESAISNARRFRTSPTDELLLYVAHGVLHILGFDDHGKTKTMLMRKKEREYGDR